LSNAEEGGGGPRAVELDALLDDDWSTAVLDGQSLERPIGDEGIDVGRDARCTSSQPPDRSPVLGDRILRKRSSSAHGADDELTDGLGLAQRRWIEDHAREDALGQVEGRGLIGVRGGNAIPDR